VFATAALVVGDTDRKREAQFSLASLVHHVLRPVGNRHLQFLGYLLSTPDDWESDWCNRTQSLDRRTVVEPAISEEPSNIERQGRDQVEQPLDRVALWFISADSSDSDNERLGPTEDESNEVAMTLGGAIAGDRVTEFSRLGVWTAVVVDTDEVKADDPRPRTQDHRPLLHENVVNDAFEFSRRDGVQLSQRVVVGVCPESAVGASLD